MLGIRERGLFERLKKMSCLGQPPEGQRVRGTSTLYDADGVPKLQWVKADHEKDREALRIYAEELSRTIPKQKPIAAPKVTQSHLLNLYTLTDCHIGALSWDRETGENWDTQIAERTISECFRLMVESSPKAEACIVNQLGDFLHFDSLVAVTPTSGHILDSDSRYQKVVEVAARVLRRVVNLALENHRRVHLCVSDSNHDPVGGTWLRVLFSALYEKDKRVTVSNSPNPYVAYQWGNTMLAFHHGHQAKFEKLAGVFAAQFPEIWGVTRKRYCHVGHYHHSRLQEDAGMVIEQHPTLAARDAYAARLGLHAIRRVDGITYHNKWGQVGRVSIFPEMVEDGVK
jgi:hypothetical protein